MNTKSPAWCSSIVTQLVLHHSFPWCESSTKWLLLYCICHLAYTKVTHVVTHDATKIALINWHKPEVLQTATPRVKPSSKLTKSTNPFLTMVEKKSTAQHIICLITDAEDDVKDTIIQEVFMKQGLWNTQTQWPGGELYMRYAANLCTLLGYKVWKYQSLSTHLMLWPTKGYW